MYKMPEFTGNKRNYAPKLQHHNTTCQTVYPAKVKFCNTLRSSMLVSAGWTGTSVQLMEAQAFSLESDLTISNKLKNTLHF